MKLKYEVKENTYVLNTNTTKLYLTRITQLQKNICILPCGPQIESHSIDLELNMKLDVSVFLSRMLRLENTLQSETNGTTSSHRDP